MADPILILKRGLFFIQVPIYNLSLIQRDDLKVIIQESICNCCAMTLILIIK